MSTPHYRCLPSELQPLLNKFYRSHRSPMRGQAGDEVWVAQSSRDIVAALSLRPVSAGQWLTGLFVAPALRRQGVAGELLRACLAQHPEAIWLFCHPQLRCFYQRQGFVDCDPLPAELAERLARYRRNKPLVSLRAH